MIKINKLTACILTGALAITLVTGCSKNNMSAEESKTFESESVLSTSRESTAGGESGKDSTEADAKDTTEVDGKDTTEADVNDTSESLAEAASGENAVNLLTFPYELDGGKLKINSIFSSDIFNPDADNEQIDNLVAMELENQSDETLTACSLLVKLKDGREIPFEISFLPPGKSLWAFATDNSSSESTDCTEITVKASSYSDEALLMADRFSVSVDGDKVSILNCSDTKAENIRITCHCMLDGFLFGGKTYVNTIDELDPGATEEFYAEGCLAGDAEVVKIELGD